MFGFVAEDEAEFGCGFDLLVLVELAD